MTDIDTFTDRLNPDMCVVTASAGGRRAGCLVGFFCQCSIQPARFAVWISKANHTFGVAIGAERVAVHFLTESDRPLAELFGGETEDRVDKFAECNWRPGDLLIIFKCNKNIWNRSGTAAPKRALDSLLDG